MTLASLKHIVYLGSFQLILILCLPSLSLSVDVLSLLSFALQYIVIRPHV